MNSVSFAVLGGVLVALLSACGDDSAGSGGAGSTTTTTSGGTGGQAPTGWIAGACGVCFSEKCAPQVAACDGDPGCAATFSCLEACAAEPVDGPAQEACAAACTVPDSSTALAAYQALDACRTTGDGFNSCPSCQPEDDQPLCEPAVPPSNCTLCLERECCETIGKYRANAEAQAMNDCLIGCDDEFAECVPACADQHPDGFDDWATNVGCYTLYCLGEDNCGNPGEPIDPCDQCLADNCAASSFACDSEPECVLYSYCFDLCGGDVPCSQACEEEHPDGTALFDAFTACATSSCEDVCGD